MILLPNVDRYDHAADMAQNIMQTFNYPHNTDNYEELIQGYVISRPITDNDAMKMLAETKGAITGLRP